MKNINYILFSKNNLILGERIRKVLKKINADIFYYNDLCKTIDFLTSTENTLVFIEKCYGKYAKILSSMICSSVFKNSALVFIDEGKEVQKYINQKNVFNVNENFVDSEIFDIITMFTFNSGQESIVDVANIKIKLSKLLIEAGLCVKHVGFGYVKDCLEYVAKRNFKLGGLHGDVYKHVACLNNTNECNVERSIRNCILQAKKNNEALLYEFTKSSNSQLTNKAFLGYVLERLQEECVSA